MAGGTGDDKQGGEIYLKSCTIKLIICTKTTGTSTGGYEKGERGGGGGGGVMTHQLLEWFIHGFHTVSLWLLLCYLK